MVLHRYSNASKKPYPPNDIIDDIRREYGISLCYRKALAVKRHSMKLLFGSDEVSYQLLPSMCHVIGKANPQSVITLVRHADSVFKYMFMSLSAWREAWDHCILVVTFDGTFMKGYFKGTLLTACTRDANRQLVPLAFGICNSENKDSWKWFFSELKLALSYRHNLYIVSDRNAGIIKSVKDFFPSAGHGYCVHHLAGNIRSQFKGSADGKEWKFNAVARASTYKEYQEYMALLDLEDPRIRAYLDKIGSDKWARCMSGPYRYNIMTVGNNLWCSI
ncbi:unnamed protein product [Cuscuta europaea]|uniref:MULE transposase domain-containing protein n=1 Tax=Cuscuta europaea TaxID=41803 RepID=A0A9P0ZB25_CUSEU|nr:unnamed protein product [Cuscuta europaea]